MRILQLTKKFPYPPKDGESIAILAMAEGYNMIGHDIDLFAMNTSKHRVDVDMKNLTNLAYQQIWTCDVDTKVKPLEAFCNIFTNTSYNIARFDNGSYRNQLIEILSNHEYDVVQLETLYLTPFIETIRRFCSGTVILRSHNIEHEIWYNLSKTETNILSRAYYKLCFKRLKKYELSTINQYDLILAISDVDREKYLNIDSTLKTATIEVGINLSNYQKKLDAEKSQYFGYIGSLDWRPNLEGLSWFFDDIWPALNTKFPDIKFLLAGRNPDAEFVNKLPLGVEYLGEVDDAAAFISTLDAVIVPLLSGSGIRIKILESMAMAKSVFSTDKGFEGINVEDMRNAVVFNSRQDLIEKIGLWKSNYNIRKSLGDNSRKYIFDNFDTASINKKIIVELNKLSSNKN